MASCAFVAPASAGTPASSALSQKATEQLALWRWDAEPRRGLLQCVATPRWSAALPVDEVLRTLLRCAGSRLEGRRNRGVVVRLGQHEMSFENPEAAVRALLTYMNGNASLLPSTEEGATPGGSMLSYLSAEPARQTSNKSLPVALGQASDAPAEYPKLLGAQLSGSKGELARVCEKASLRRETWTRARSGPIVRSNARRSVTPRSNIASWSQTASWSQILDETPRARSQPRVRSALQSISASRSSSCGRGFGDDSDEDEAARSCERSDRVVREASCKSLPAHGEYPKLLGSQFSSSNGELPGVLKRAGTASAATTPKAGSGSRSATPRRGATTSFGATRSWHSILRDETPTRGDRPTPRMRSAIHSISASRSRSVSRSRPDFSEAEAPTPDL